MISFHYTFVSYHFLMYLELVKQVAGVHQSLSEIDYDLSALQSMVSGLVSYASIFMVVID